MRLIDDCTDGSPSSANNGTLIPRYGLILNFCERKCETVYASKCRPSLSSSPVAQTHPRMVERGGGGRREGRNTANFFGSVSFSLFASPIFRQSLGGPERTSNPRQLFGALVYNSLVNAGFLHSLFFGPVKSLRTKKLKRTSPTFQFWTAGVGYRPPCGDYGIVFWKGREKKEKKRRWLLMFALYFYRIFRSNSYKFYFAESMSKTEPVTFRRLC